MLLRNDQYADIVIGEKTGLVLSKIVEQIKAKPEE